MATSLLRGGLLFVAALAVVFQLYLKDPIWLGLGIGKVFQPLSDFPYTCRKIVHPEMEACEDMWLSESTRQLFLTCSDPLSRNEWMPKYAIPVEDLSHTYTSVCELTADLYQVWPN